MRQRWEDEGERQKMLSEKHARGSLARSNREARVQLKETRKILKANRTSRIEDQNKKPKVNKAESLQRQSIESENTGIQPQEQQKNLQSHQEEKIQKKCLYSKNCRENIFVSSETLHGQPGSLRNVSVPVETIHQTKNSTSMPSRSSFLSQNHENSMKRVPQNCSFPRSPLRVPLASINCSTRAEHNNPHSFRPRVGASHNSSTRVEYDNPCSFRPHVGALSPLRRMSPTRAEYYNPQSFRPCVGAVSPLRSRNSHEQSSIFNSWRNPNPLGPFQRHAHVESANFSPTKGPFQRQGHQQRQLCRFYAQGRCYYGDQCKYLHEYRDNSLHY